MCSRRKLSFLGVWVLLILTTTQAFPEDRQARQEDEDEPRASTRSPYDFGSHVAQIITGAFTGNIDSIIKGSFGFIDDPNVNKLSHNTWETLKGNPTETPPWQSTAASAGNAKPAQAAPASAPVRPAAVPEIGSAPASSGGSPAAPNVYHLDNDFPTRAPTRTTQPTYATLAPLSVVEGETETEEPSTTKGADTDDDDEAEGLSAEVPEASTTSTVQKASTAAAEVSTVANAETTTEDDDDQVDLDNFYNQF